VSSRADFFFEGSLRQYAVNAAFVICLTDMQHSQCQKRPLIYLFTISYGSALFMSL
jgi:hypothetical protein